MHASEQPDIAELIARTNLLLATVSLDIQRCTEIKRENTHLHATNLDHLSRATHSVQDTIALVESLIEGHTRDEAGPSNRTHQ